MYELFQPARVDPLFASAIRNGIRRPPRKFSQWLVEELVIPDGPSKGERFQFARQPITKLWAEAIDSGKYTEHVYSGPSQSGKSLIGYVAPLLYHACELGENLVFGVPMEEMADDKWQADIQPAMEASGRMRRLLPKKGSGSAGGKIRDRVTLANSAMLKIATAGGSDQGKAGFTARVVCITEAARFSRTGGESKETDPLRQLYARQRAYPTDQRVTYIEGTKTIRLEYPFALREQSTKSRIVSECPHCGDWVEPGREELIGWQTARTEIEAHDLATWSCPYCKEPIDESERYQMLLGARLIHDGQLIKKNGQVVGDSPETSRLWFDYNAWHNAFLKAGDIAIDLWAANQFEPETAAREAAEKQVSQFVFGIIYDPPALQELEELNPDTVADRRLDLPRGVAPEDTIRITLGIDVGDRQLHWVAIAERECGAVHVVDYGTQDVPLRAYSLRSAIRKAIVDLVDSLAPGYVGAGERGRIPISAAYCDSGHEPDAVFDAVKELKAKDSPIRILPILGRGETQMEKRKYTAPTKTGNVIRKIDPNGRWHLSKVKRAGVDQLTIDTDSIKILVSSSLIVALGASGALSLFSGPQTVHRKFSRQITSEQMIVEQIPGQPPKKRWIRTGANHYLDAVAYALVALLRQGWAPDSLDKDPTASKQPEWEYAP
jgi:phage terminase large subunit GpA-like protein